MSGHGREGGAEEAAVLGKPPPVTICTEWMMPPCSFLPPLTYCECMSWILLSSSLFSLTAARSCSSSSSFCREIREISDSSLDTLKLELVAY